MEEELRNYIESIFKNAVYTPQTADLKEEIMQNTLDRYRDLIADGYSPEEAYKISVSGIGNVKEIIDSYSVYCQNSGQTNTSSNYFTETQDEYNQIEKKRTGLLAAGVMLCIVSVIPPIIFSETKYSETLGPALMFLFVAAAVALFIIRANTRHRSNYGTASAYNAPRKADPILKSIKTVIFTICLVLYFVISFATHAWFITWLMFPICGCIQGVAEAVADLLRKRDE